MIDSSGNLYGTTLGGGEGFGTVFQVVPAGGRSTESVLYSFQETGPSGFNPMSASISDAAGKLYGTASFGGANGEGTVFELTPVTGGGWTETTLYSFQNNGTDGMSPFAGLIFDAVGNLYGTTKYGGTFGVGTVFELTPATGGTWTESVLYSFQDNGSDGTNPASALVIDGSGNLYGTTSATGSCVAGCGTVFELSPGVGSAWTETVVYSFSSSDNDGNTPQGGLVIDASGNLYGTTAFGGNGSCFNGLSGCGTVFALRRPKNGNWSEKILYSFKGGMDGYYPFAGLTLDASGNLYGTTFVGGTGTCSGGCGTVFELKHKTSGGWIEKVLYSFQNNGTDGNTPQTGLTIDTFGNLYGTTYQGGTHNLGTVYEIKP